MEIGNVIEWRGACRTERAVIVRVEGAEPVARMSSGKTFALRDLRWSKSVRLVDEEERK